MKLPTDNEVVSDQSGFYEKHLNFILQIINSQTDILWHSADKNIN